MPDDYEVGYRKPPAEHQYQKGQTGNPKGRPANQKQSTVDVIELLGGNVKVRVKGTEKTMPAFEVTVTRLAQDAIKESKVRSAIEFIILCEKYGVLESTIVNEPSVIFVPKDTSYDEWMASLTTVGPSSDD